MMRTAFFIALAVVMSSSAAGCGDKKDWDSEIIVQLFQPLRQGVRDDLGTVTVEATQAGKTSTVKLADAFSSCTANQVRIILVNSTDTVHVLARSDKVVTIRAEENIDPRDAQGRPVPLRLGLATSYEPEACAPPPISVPPDGGVKKPTGAACGSDADCVGGKCLEELDHQGTTYTLQDKYCSAACDYLKSDCEAKVGGGDCFHPTNPNGTHVLLQPYGTCMQSCGGEGDCRLGYTCSAGKLCFPKAP